MARRSVRLSLGSGEFAVCRESTSESGIILLAYRATAKTKMALCPGLSAIYHRR